MPISANPCDPDSRSSLGALLIAHAKLASSLRCGADKTPVFYHSSLCYWRDLFPNSDRAGSTLHYLNQLACRTLIQMTWSFPSMDKVFKSAMEGQSSLNEEVLSSCSDLISSSFHQLDGESFVATLPLGFDLFSAAVTILCLASDSATGRPGFPLQLSAVVHECMTLLTITGERLPNLKPLRRVLQALFNVVMMFPESSKSVSRGVCSCKRPWLNDESRTWKFW
jgi:hypothetical protein